MYGRKSIQFHTVAGVSSLWLTALVISIACRAAQPDVVHVIDCARRVAGATADADEKWVSQKTRNASTVWKLN